ncbi:ead/Ea22-like family protein [Salmonella enterica subsp. enterica serovar Napoli]|nr:ead/Ea22-like family protein [Salmonella enterica]EBW3006213.1 ead/Ea22-like family protein [Salmonella enterica subsp. enterica serovar Coeln]EBX1464464.1 ead/Ea22-like family protein [Salmonella enterica subsp. salamae serovar Sofia]EBX4282580.1 ead/Ea22-like family protein [Salmonella enterica subsp. enterica serovar Napoli]ECJ2284861.1 ead/Ea22-like family protein [Salmonella enterica subsp. diarizonae]ECJ2391502.1 ead/Ea22-like family protein [Salmonella enterica subsp. salamae]ECQ640
MTIDKQALRNVAEKATPGNWRRSSSRFNGITATPFSLCGEEVMLAHTVEKRDAEFIAAANPRAMLALLDELCSANGYASAYEAEKWHYHGLAESEGERADRAEKQVEELTMWVKRLAHSLRNARPNSKLHSAAMDYLSHKGLISVEDVLR